MSLKHELDFNNNVAAEKQFRLSIIFGGIGLLFGGLILGVFAIVYAKRAERLGHRQAIVGKALGIIDILANIVGIIIAIAFFALNAS
jgi:hypothetical protein